MSRHTNTIDNTVSVFNGAACDATHHAGCRRPAPSMPDAEFFISADPATHTLYGSSLTQKQIDVIDGVTCHAGDLSGCAPVAVIPTPDFGPNVGAIDDATHTLYASDESPAGKVLVINTATCNATDTSGCGAAPAAIAVGAFPNPRALSILNTATCNGTHTAGCHRHFPTAATGRGPFAVALGPHTGLVYVTDFAGAAVTILNGARCNATVTTGCGAARKQAVGSKPLGLAIDPGSHTAYVTDVFRGRLGEHLPDRGALTAGPVSAPGRPTGPAR